MEAIKPEQGQQQVTTESPVRVVCVRCANMSALGCLWAHLRGRSASQRKMSQGRIE